MSKEMKLIPDLRFPEFANDGEWVEDKLGKRGVFTGGGTPSKSNSEYWNGEFPWVSSSDISEDSIHQINITRFITENSIKDSATKIVPTNSLLIVSRVGVGKVAVSNEEICTSQDFTNYTPQKDDPEFLGYYLKSNKNLLLGFSQGMAIKGFTKDDISGLNLPFPKKEEQQKIASCLSSLDELIAAHNDKLEALKDHKKGLLQNLFPQEGESVPKVRFPEFEDDGEWVENELGKICDVRDGTHDSPKYASDGFPLITSKNLLKNGAIDFENVSYLTQVDYDKINQRSKVDVGDILFGMIGTIGNPVIVKKDGFAIKNVALIKTKGLLEQEYLLQLLKSNYIDIQFQKANAGGILKFIALGMIRKLIIPTPQKEEQQKIATCLSAVDALITAQQEKVEELQLHKKGLMQGLFPKIER